MLLWSLISNFNFSPKFSRLSSFLDFGVVLSKNRLSYSFMEKVPRYSESRQNLKQKLRVSFYLRMKGDNALTLFIFILVILKHNFTL